MGLNLLISSKGVIEGDLVTIGGFCAKSPSSVPPSTQNQLLGLALVLRVGFGLA